jgi:predicted ArsR family transcriptional regulator
LERLGFAPETEPAATSVRLTCCPLLEAARRQPDVVCGVHLGIVQGALAEWGVPAQQTELSPFAERGACRLLIVTDQPTPTTTP